MSSLTCCIIIPIYNVNPSSNEVRSINRVISVLASYDIYFICPEHMDVTFYRKLWNCKFIIFDDKYFKSNKSYSRLLLSKKFYYPFLEYKYILISQTDSLILNTDPSLQEFLNKGYDYWGAPWSNGPFSKPYTFKDYLKLLYISHPEQCKVGNGGFSLRKTKSTYMLVCKKYLFLKWLWHFNEDLFFSWYALSHASYTAAPVSEATFFAAETTMKEQLNNGQIPFAVHAWEKYCTYKELEKYTED